MEIEQSLEKVGLSKQEASVYLSTLKLGISKASEIAIKSNVKREATYYILKSLQEKGFISEIIKSGVKHYSAIKPKRILEIIEEERQQKKETIREILPELESLEKVALTRPKIEFYGGLEGMKTVASVLVEKRNQTVYAYIAEKVIHFLPSFNPQFRRKRKEMNVKLKVISKKTGFMEEMKKKDKEELREIRFNDKIIKGLDACYYILEDAIVIIKANEKEQLGIYLKEESTARLHKRVFENIWKESKK